jgi:predicted DNA binding protein
MWIARFKLYHNDCPAVNTCVSQGVDVTSYPLGFNSEDGNTYVTTLCKILAPDAKKDDYISQFRKDPNITNIDINGDFFAYQYRLEPEDGEHVQLYTNPKMFFVKPTLNSKDRHEYWELASWDKSTLTRFSDEVTSHMDYAEILGISKKTLYDFYAQIATPKLSKGQKDALRLAYNHDYYSFPRKTGLDDLAKRAGLSVSTFQEHLRKAENKLMPTLAARALDGQEAG